MQLSSAVAAILLLQSLSSAQDIARRAWPGVSSTDEHDVATFFARSTLGGEEQEEASLLVRSLIDQFDTDETFLQARDDKDKKKKFQWNPFKREKKKEEKPPNVALAHVFSEQARQHKAASLATGNTEHAALHNNMANLANAHGHTPRMKLLPEPGLLAKAALAHQKEHDYHHAEAAKLQPKTGLFPGKKHTPYNKEIAEQYRDHETQAADHAKLHDKLAAKAEALGHPPIFRYKGE